MYSMRCIRVLLFLTIETGGLLAYPARCPPRRFSLPRFWGKNLVFRPLVGMCLVKHLLVALRCSALLRFSRTFVVLR